MGNGDVENARDTYGLRLCCLIGVLPNGMVKKILAPVIVKQPHAKAKGFVIAKAASRNGKEYNYPPELF